MSTARAGVTVGPGDFRLGGWLVRPSLNEISRRGASRRLRPQLMDLLVLLAGRAGQVLPREEILARIWGRQFVAETVLHRSIAELRESLAGDPGSPSVIETIPKRGYRLIAPVVDPAEIPVKTRQPSVLVLPFRDLSERGDQQYFSDGLSEQIINALTRVRGLRVIARASAFRVGREAADLSEIKKLVNVDMILEGGVRKVGNQIRITVELVDVASECYVWSECCDRTADSIFELHDEITLKVVEGLKVELLGREPINVVKRSTESVEAHTSYLRGLYQWNQRSGEGIRLCREHLKRAIEQDPGYPLPYVTLAYSHITAGVYGLVPPKESLPEARRLASQALAMDSGLGEAHAALGYITFLYDRDWPASEASFRRALAVNPHCPMSCVWYALCLSWAGQPEEAAEMLERAYLSDPLSSFAATMRGVLLYQREQFGEARHQFRQVLEVDPDYPLAHLHLARALIALGEYEQAILRAPRVSALSLPLAHAFVGIAHARAGRTAEAEAILTELLDTSKEDYVAPTLIAYLYVALRRSDSALGWFREAKRLRDPLLPLNAGSDPFLSELRSVPEFQALQREE